MKAQPAADGTVPNLQLPISQHPHDRLSTKLRDLGIEARVGIIDLRRHLQHLVLEDEEALQGSWRRREQSIQGH
jgi:hypothetical protein